MNKLKTINKLICRTGILISGLLIAIYFNKLIYIETFWQTFKTMQITMYWFSVAFFFRLGPKQLIFIFLYAFFRGFTIIALGELLNRQFGFNSSILHILGTWVYFQILTSSMVKRPYADFIYYKAVDIIHRTFGVTKGKLLQETYNRIMDDISLDTIGDWKYYNWIYFKQKEAKRKDGSGELCATSRLKPHEGWVVFYFHYILPNEKYATNLKEVKIMQPYTSLLGMEGTERVAERIEIFLKSYDKQDDLTMILNHIINEMKKETLIMNTEKSPL